MHVANRKTCLPDSFRSMCTRTNIGKQTLDAVLHLCRWQRVRLYAAGALYSIERTSSLAGPTNSTMTWNRNGMPSGPQTTRSKFTVIVRQHESACGDLVLNGWA